MTENEKLKEQCRGFRKDVITVLHETQSGHPGGSLSVCEIVATLILKHMNIDPAKPDDPERDRLILSKGHAAPMLYRVLAEKGYFPVKELHTLRALNSRMQGHTCMLDTPGIDLTSGPLGLGLPAGIGMALSKRLDGSKARIYVVLGDGELNEGSVWEAAMAAVKFKVDNLCAILDWNGVQLDGTCNDIMPMGDIRAKFEAFGWQCIEVNGHEPEELLKAYKEAEKIKGKPTIILAHTVKGKGVSFMEGKNTWHGKAVDDESFRIAMQELGGEC
ncbi:MAG: transketolase [Spirochaetales bacterium]|nr:transketolase [Spirochaetales bacterium]